MLIQWCLKGIAERNPGFGDKEAQAVIAGTGLHSSWLRNVAAPSQDLPALSHGSLSRVALDRHVLSFGAVAGATPYISLTAGTVELDPSASPRVYPAFRTALEFATQSATTSGYVFRLWVLVSPKPAPELPGFAEEVRELNSFSNYGIFHYEGEVAAKLFVPARQIERVEKYDANLNLVGTPWVNPDFVPPERINNVLDLL